MKKIFNQHFKSLGQFIIGSTLTSQTQILSQLQISQIKALIKYQNILLIKKLIKINKSNKRQQRVIVITNQNIYNIHFSKIIRTIKILSVQGISLSLTSNEFVLHIPSEYDYRYESYSRVQILHTILKARFLYLNQKDEIRLFLFELQSLDFITTTEDCVKKKKFKYPTIKPVFVEMNSINIQIMKRIYVQQQVLYVSSSFSKNYEKKDYKKLMKINNAQVYEQYIIKCVCTDSLYTLKIFNKQHLITDLQSLKTRLSSFPQNKFFQKIQLITLKGQFIHIICTFYSAGDLFNQIQIISPINQNILKHIFVRAVLAINEVNFILRSLTIQNLPVDVHGNTYISSQLYFINQECPIEYLSPQQIFELYNTKSIENAKLTNLWKLGIIMYELAFGVAPFTLTELIYEVYNKKEIYVKFPRNDNRSKDFHDFLILILKKNPRDRIGSIGFLQEIQKIEWLKCINWQKYKNEDIHPEKYINIGQFEDIYFGKIEMIIN